MRRPDRAHHVGTLTPPAPDAAPGGGIDLDLPGAFGRLRATRWPGRSDLTGPPVLLLHGLGADRRYWDRVAPDLRPLPVLALDARGHGGTPDAGPLTEQSPAALATDAAVALDALGLSRVVVVGHSWGGAVALSLAAAHSDRVLAVIALDGGFTPRRSAEQRVALAATLLADDAPPARRAQLAGLLDLDPATLLPQIAVPCWLVACSSLPDRTGVAPAGVDAPPGSTGASDWSAAKLTGLEQARGLLSRPRLMHWAGANHDVPLQWPALVTGLVRAAADDVAGGGR